MLPIDSTGDPGAETRLPAGGNLVLGLLYNRQEDARCEFKITQ